MPDSSDLERRIRVLEDIEAIKRLKYRYFRHLDNQEWEALRACFTPDATTSYADGTLSQRGIDAIIEFMKSSLGSAIARGRMGAHLGHHPEIDITGDGAARAIWALDDFSADVTARTARRMGAYYVDEYVKIDGQWKIKHTGYATLYYGTWPQPGLEASARPPARLRTPTR